MFTAYLGLVPNGSAGVVWSALKAWGLEQMGDYGAFIFLNALAMGTRDDGSAMLEALAKCDAFSWCNEMREYNATMTTESLGRPSATYSHPWFVKSRRPIGLQFCYREPRLRLRAPYK